VGIISFFQLIISVTFFSPLNYTLRNTLFRVVRPLPPSPSQRKC